MPPHLTEKAEPVEARNSVLCAGIRDLEGCCRCPPWTLSGYHGAVSHAREGDDEGIGTPPFGLFVDKPRATLHDLGDGRHLRVVERKKEAVPAAQHLGEDIFAAFLASGDGYTGRGREAGFELHAAARHVAFCPACRWLGFVLLCAHRRCTRPAGGPEMTVTGVIDTCLKESLGKCLATAWGQGWLLVVLLIVAGIAVWFLRKVWLDPITKALAERVEKRAGRRLAAGALSDTRRQYLEAFTEDHRHFKFRGLDTQARGVRTPEIDEAFVSLQVVPDAEPDTPKTAEGGRDPGDPRLSREQVEPVDLAGAIKHSAKLAIIGAAGCGKSTLLQWAGLAVARTGLGAPLRDSERAFVDALGGSDLTPVLVSLAAFNQHCKEQKLDRTPAAFLDFLAASLGQAHPMLGLTQEFFESQLKRGCLLMLDGLDEVNPDDRERVREAVEGLLREFRQSTRNRYLVSGRSVAYRGRAEVADFRKCVVQPLTPEQRDALVRGWYEAIHPNNLDEARHRAADLCGRIDRSDERVKTLAVTPLMVTIFALVHFDQRELPRQRAELYEHAVRVLLTERFKAEEVVETLKRVGGMEWQTRRDRLARIAFELHKLRERGDAVPEDDLVGLVWPAFGSEVKSARDTALEFVRVVADRGGLLEEAGRQYGFFTHRTFREFLAGRYLAEELRPEERLEFLAAHLDDDHWEEPIRLAAGYLAIHGQARANDFVKALAGLGASPAARARALTLAGLALADLPPGSVERETLETVKPRMLATLTADPPVVDPPLRRRLGLALGAVGDPRIKPRREPELVRVPAGPFRMGTSRADAEKLKAQNAEPWADELAENQIVVVSAFEIAQLPVTNAEFRAFWDPKGANGYDQRRWWSDDGWRWRRGGTEADLSFIDDRDTRRRYREWLDRRPVERRSEPYFWDRPEFSGDNQPVVGVTWYEAEAYCNWLSEVTGRQRYQLPTEAEWEKAARGDDGRLWPWGNEWALEKCNSGESQFGATTSVGMYPDGTSPYKALDMAGNVWEWCSDWWAANLFKRREGTEVTDPRGPDQGAAKVVRGGAWYYARRDCRAAYRGRSVPSDFHVDLGVRVVRAPVRS